jgi:hypothetical protein
MIGTQKDIDAVTIATPDHVHAVATSMPMRLGKHVHLQKPHTHSVYEARSTSWQRPKEISNETAPLASITHYKFAASATHRP